MKYVSFYDDSTVSDPASGLDFGEEWHVRIAARAVLLNEKSQIALMYMSAIDAYKLPGGGVDKEEDIAKGFKREIKEETGCDADPIADIGVSVEKKDFQKELQISFSYLARVVNYGNPQLTEEEKERGFELRWIDSFDEALALLSTLNSDELGAHYVNRRDQEILRLAQDIYTTESL